ncbi:MAG: DUF3795 domain-containing protein [Promethearchaeota archaeon]
MKYKPNEIECDGCTVEGKIFSRGKECPIRICGIEKKVKNCAYCNEFPCDKLNPSFEMQPENKQRLDEIKENL